MPGPSSSDYLGRGIYSIPFAARLTETSPGRVTRWLWGYRRRSDGEFHEVPPVLRASYEALGGHRAVSFLDLMEVRLVAALLEAGMSLQKVRTAAARAREEITARHPFANRRFRTDGRDIFMDIMARDGTPQLLDVLHNQRAFDRFLDPFLRSGIEYCDDGVICEWRPHDDLRVVVNPRFSFGAPTTLSGRIRSSILAGSYKAEGSYKRAAWHFEVPVGAVRDAVEFERRLAA